MDGGGNDKQWLSGKEEGNTEKNRGVLLKAPLKTNPDTFPFSVEIHLPCLYLLIQ